MSRLAPILALLLTALAAGRADAAPQPVRPDRIESVRLDAHGRAELELRLEERRRLEADILVVDERFGRIDVSVLGAEGASQPLGYAAAGPLRLVVQSEHPAAGRVALRIRADPSTDPFEPNDARGQATRAAPPFSGWIELAPGDQDWFALPSGPAGVVGVRLSGVGGVEAALHDGAGAPLPQDQVAGDLDSGARYLEAPAGAVYLVLSVPADRSGGPQAGRIEIVRYAASKDAAGRLVTIGLAEDDPARRQLELAAAAMGAQTFSAEDEAGVAAAFSDALAPAAPERTDWSVFAALGVLLAALVALAAAALVSRRA